MIVHIGQLIKFQNNICFLSAIVTRVLFYAFIAYGNWLAMEYNYKTVIHMYIVVLDNNINILLIIISERNL